MDGELTGLLDARDFVGAQVDDDKRQALGLEFRDDVTAHASVTTDDDVVGKFVKHAESSFVFPICPPVTGEEEVRDCSKHTRRKRHH